MQNNKTAPSHSALVIPPEARSLNSRRSGDNYRIVEMRSSAQYFALMNISTKTFFISLAGAWLVSHITLAATSPNTLTAARSDLTAVDVTP